MLGWLVGWLVAQSASGSGSSSGRRTRSAAYLRPRSTRSALHSAGVNPILKPVAFLQASEMNADAIVEFRFPAFFSPQADSTGKLILPQSALGTNLSCQPTSSRGLFDSLLAVVCVQSKLWTARSPSR